MPELPPVDLDAIYLRAETILTAEVEQGLALMNIDSGNYYGLDSIGAAVWTRLDGMKTLAQVCLDLTKLYEVEPDRCQADVGRLVAKLLQHGAVIRQTN